MRVSICFSLCVTIKKMGTALMQNRTHFLFRVSDYFVVEGCVSLFIPNTSSMASIRFSFGIRPRLI